jgi:hypothetical protein
MTNGASPGRGMLVLGGVGGIIWLIGAILAAIIGGIGQIVLGIGILLASFAGIGFWQRTKDVVSVFVFVMALVGGILILVGGALGVAGIGAGGIIAQVGAALFGISLIAMGLVVNKLGPQLSTQAKLGMDLVFPAVATSMAGGCAILGLVQATATAPAAVLLAILFFMAK